MAEEYHDGQRSLQERFDTRRLADRLAEATATEISDVHRAFIETRDMFFLATADEHGAPECSYKGGDPGFVRVPDPTTVVFPVYDGNGMFLSAGNLSVNPQVGMLFVDFATGSRLRVNGVAHAHLDDPTVEDFPGAKFMVRVTPRAVFANCRRYVHRYEAVARSLFVPSAGHPAPVPDWKLDPWFEGTLAHDDPALDPGQPVESAIPHFGP